MIEAHGLTKRYGRRTVVDQLTFTAEPGRVTGFLGPNGAGKSTTMRMIMGLDHPTAGSVTIRGRGYGSLTRPLTEVGAVLDAKAFHPGRSARQHLLALARANGISRARVDAVIRLVGLESAAKKRAGNFSLGMGQRLGLAAALLGDPGVLILDEPVNGLDPEGVHWIRGLMRSLAAEGRTVLVSSHLMSEMEKTADHVIVIGQGKLIADQPLTDFVNRSTTTSLVIVRSLQTALLSEILVAEDGTTVTERPDGALAVTGSTTVRVGEIARTANLTLTELRSENASLENAYMELTRDSVEYAANAANSANAATTTQNRSVA
jgi:ABC-2 type transport system ATP-binding protein